MQWLAQQTQCRLGNCIKGPSLECWWRHYRWCGPGELWWQITWCMVSQWGLAYKRHYDDNCYNIIKNCVPLTLEREKKNKKKASSSVTGICKMVPVQGTNMFYSIHSIPFKVMVLHSGHHIVALVCAVWDRLMGSSSNIWKLVDKGKLYYP